MLPCGRSSQTGEKTYLLFDNCSCSQHDPRIFDSQFQKAPGGETFVSFFVKGTLVTFYHEDVPIRIKIIGKNRRADARKKMEKYCEDLGRLTNTLPLLT